MTIYLTFYRTAFLVILDVQTVAVRPLVDQNSRLHRLTQHRTMTENSKKMDWRVLFGTVLTALWILTGLIYLLGKVGWGQFVNLPTGEIGSFLEGAFAPLAFLWLVIGHFMQQGEISSNTKAIKLQEASALRQEVHAQRNAYFQLLKLVQQQLSSIAGYQYMSVCGPTGTGAITLEEYQQMRTDSTGDPELFVRKMFGLASNIRDDEAQLNELFFGTEIRTRHANNFYSTFKKLIKNAEDVDYDDLLVNALMYGSAAGILYRIIAHLKGDESIDPVQGIVTVQARPR